MSGLIVSVSGIRGIVGTQLTPLVAARFAEALSRQLTPGPIVLSRDGRGSGALFADVIRGALVAAGRDVVDAAIAATPTVGLLVRRHQAAGGVQVTASHNPPEYNGIKLFGPDGSVLSAADGDQVRRRFEQAEAEWSTFNQLGMVQFLDDSISAHLNAVLDRVDVELIVGRKYRVLLDSNHASGSRLAVPLLERLGCRLTVLGGTPDGEFAHPPEPTATNLQQVGKSVVESGADIGFCQDPDADRLAVIDAQGRYLGEEYTLALCLNQVLGKTPGPIVTNCATSRMAADLARQHGVTCHLSAVGEANVVAKMRQCQAVFGGEGNGGPIDPQVGMIRDSFVGMALILESMAANNATVADLAGRLPSYVICKRKQPMDPERLAAARQLLERRFPDAQASDMDGLRLDWNDRWLLVRASNTEPIMRVIAEASTAEQADQLCDAAAQVLADG